MAKKTSRKKNPTMTSRRGKHRGKKGYAKERYISEYTIEQAKKSGSPWVELDPERSTQPVFIVNPLDVEGGDNGIDLFQFGAVGTTYLAVLNMSLEDGLEEAAGWLADHAPGHLTDLKDEYKDALKELVEDGEDPEDDATIQRAQEQAEEDMTYTESGYLTSHEWFVNTIYDTSDLGQRIINKAKNQYRKQYGEDPYRQRPLSRASMKKYGDPRWKKSGLSNPGKRRRNNPDLSATSAQIRAIADRLARGG